MELHIVEVRIWGSSGGEGWVEALVAVAASSLSSLLLFLTPDLPFIPIVTVKLCCRWTRQGTAEECEVWLSVCRTQTPPHHPTTPRNTPKKIKLAGINKRMQTLRRISSSSWSSWSILAAREFIRLLLHVVDAGCLQPRIEVGLTSFYWLRTHYEPNHRLIKAPWTKGMGHDYIL